jgi:hypothetical protein
MPHPKSRWTTITITVDIAAKSRIQEAARQHGLPVGGFVKMLIGNYLEITEGLSAPAYYHLPHELLLQRIFFYVTGRNEVLCRRETGSFEEFLTARFTPRPPT